MVQGGSTRDAFTQKVALAGDSTFLASISSLSSARRASVNIEASIGAPAYASGPSVEAAPRRSGPQPFSTGEERRRASKAKEAMKAVHGQECTEAEERPEVRDIALLRPLESLDTECEVTGCRPHPIKLKCPLWVGGRKPQNGLLPNGGGCHF